MADEIASMDEREVFARVLRNGISNTIWFGIGAVVIWLIGKFFWSVGVGLFLIYALITVIDCLWIVISTLLPSFVATPVAISSALRGDREALGKEGYMLAALLVRLLEAGISVIATLYLYYFFFPSSHA